MCAPSDHSDPVDEADRQIDASFRAVVRSALHSESRAFDAALAADGECPTAEDVAFLDAGQIVDPARREALARHLVSCPRCLEANLAALLVPVCGGTGRSSGPLRVVKTTGVPTLATWAAAAALLLCAYFAQSPTGSATNSALGGTWLVDPYGLEMRSAPRAPVGRRVLLQAKRGGFVALVRLSTGATAGTGPTVVEPVDDTHVTVAVTSGDELILPLDHAIAVPTSEDWLVLWLDMRLDAAGLEALATRVARGARPTGVEAQRLIVPPTSLP